MATLLSNVLRDIKKAEANSGYFSLPRVLVSMESIAAYRFPFYHREGINTHLRLGCRAEIRQLGAVTRAVRATRPLYTTQQFTGSLGRVRINGARFSQLTRIPPLYTVQARQRIVIKLAM